MHFVKKNTKEKRLDFVKKLKKNKILRAPGAYNPLTAKLIEEIGYDAVYVSGGVMSNDLGYPDIGLTQIHAKARLRFDNFGIWQDPDGM